MSKTTDDVTANAEEVTADAIAAKFGQLKDEVETATGAAQATATKVGIAAGIALLILAFILGSRKGKRGKTVVEVRRL